MGWHGKTIRDVSGNDHTGTLAGTFTNGLKPGEKGQAILNAATDEYTNVPTLTASAQKTLCMWVNLTQGAIAWNTFWEFGNDAPWIGTDATEVMKTYQTTATSADALVVGEWTHVAIATRVGFTQWYINGQANGSASSAALFDVGVGFGICRHSGDAALFALWTDCLYYARCLSPGEINALYKDSKAPFRRKSRTISYAAAAGPTLPIQMLTINSKIENSLLQR